MVAADSLFAHLAFIILSVVFYHPFASDFDVSFSLLKSAKGTKASTMTKIAFLCKVKTIEIV